MLLTPSTPLLFSSSAMKQILGAAHGHMDSAPTPGDTSSNISPYRSMGNLNFSMLSAASFTPHMASSPMPPSTSRKSGLSYTSSANRSMPRSSSAGGIALNMHNTSPPRLNRAQLSFSTNKIPGIEFPSFEYTMPRSRSFAPGELGIGAGNSAMRSTLTVGALEPVEAKHLYFAHYNGLEVRCR
jgi:hypothetical protein